MSKEVVFIAGAGLMGRDIALIFANYGYNVILFDISENTLHKASSLHKKQISMLINMGLLQDEYAYEKISYTTDIDDVHKADFVFESIVEDLEIKREFFKDIEKYLSKDIIFATNTSSYTVSELSIVLTYPERLGVMHFSNPPIETELIEVAGGNKTTDSTLEEIIGKCRSIGKKPVVLDKECRGFVLNRLLYVAFADALLRIDEGEPPQNIDLGVKNLGVSYGVVEEMDLIGLDITMKVFDNLIEAYGDRYSYPKNILMNLIKEGRLGKKSGSGFYRWVSGKAVIPEGEASDPSRTIAVVVNEAYRIKNEEVLRGEEIDEICKLGVKTPVGIFDMAELFGLENLTDLLIKLYKENDHPVYQPTFKI